MRYLIIDFELAVIRRAEVLSDEIIEDCAPDLFEVVDTIQGMQYDGHSWFEVRDWK